VSRISGECVMPATVRRGPRYRNQRTPSRLEQRIASATGLSWRTVSSALPGWSRLIPSLLRVLRAESPEHPLLGSVRAAMEDVEELPMDTGTRIRLYRAWIDLLEWERTYTVSPPSAVLYRRGMQVIDTLILQLQRIRAGLVARADELKERESA